MPLRCSSGVQEDAAPCFRLALGRETLPNHPRRVRAQDSKFFGKISLVILAPNFILSYLKEKLPHSISLRRLQTEVQHLMEICLWASGHHWSSHPSRRKRSETNTIVRVAYFKNLNWFCFNFCKYHCDAVEVIRVTPTHERFFYKKTIDRYTSFKVWCIDAKHFERVLTLLQQIPDIELEFIVHPSRHGLVVPEPFQRMGLTFYKRPT